MLKRNICSVIIKTIPTSLCRFFQTCGQSIIMKTGVTLLATDQRGFWTNPACFFRLPTRLENGEVKRLSYPSVIYPCMLFTIVLIYNMYLLTSLVSTKLLARTLSTFFCASRGIYWSAKMHYLRISFVDTYVEVY